MNEEKLYKSSLERVMSLNMRDNVSFNLVDILYGFDDGIKNRICNRVSANLVFENVYFAGFPYVHFGASSKIYFLRECVFKNCIFEKDYFSLRSMTKELTMGGSRNELINCLVLNPL